MVDTRFRNQEHDPSMPSGADRGQLIADMDWRSTPGRASSRPWNTLLLLAVILAAGTALAIGRPGGTQSFPGSHGANVVRAHFIDPRWGHHGLTGAVAATTTLASRPTTTTTVATPI